LWIYSHRQQVLKFFAILFIVVSLFVSFHLLVGLLATTKNILEFVVSDEAVTSNSESCSTDDAEHSTTSSSVVEEFGRL
jgi:hypothetical protein